MDGDERAIADQFWRAAHGLQSWDSAIASLVTPLRGRCGQIAVADPLIGITAGFMSDVSPRLLEHLIAGGSFDASVNPRIRALAKVPFGQCHADEDVIDPAIKAEVPIFKGLFRETGAYDSLMIRFPVTAEGSFGAFAVLRPEHEGGASSSEKRLIERIAPAILAAVESAHRLGRNHTDLLVQTLAGTGGVAIALGWGRKIVALSPGAEEMVRTGHHFSSRRGALILPDRESDRRFDRLFSAVSGRHVDRRTICIRPGAEGPAAPLLATIVPVPFSSSGPLFPAIALVYVTTGQHANGLVEAISDALRLTPAEASVILSVGEGMNVANIARIRNVSHETVRAQIKSIMMKTGRRKQSELVALMSSLIH